MLPWILRHASEPVKIPKPRTRVQPTPERREFLERHRKQVCARNRIYLQAHRLRKIWMEGRRSLGRGYLVSDVLESGLSITSGSHATFKVIGPHGVRKETLA
jgi:hypothetical protein